MNDYIKGWEEQPEKIKELTDKGVVPLMKDMEDEKDVDMPFLMGQVAAIIKDIKPAKVIVEDMIREAVDMIKLGQTYVVPGAKSKL